MNTIRLSPNENIAKKISEVNDNTTVVLSEGRYFINKEIELKNRKNITIESDGTVIISGAKLLDNKKFKKVTNENILNRVCENARNKLYSYDLETDEITNFGKWEERGFRRPYVNAPLQLFKNGEIQSFSRYPKKGFLPIGEVIDKGSVPRDGDFSEKQPIFKYTDDRISKWKDEKNAMLSGVFYIPWADATIGLDAIDEKEKTIKLKSPHLYGVFQTDENNPGRGFFGLNLFCELSEVGEFYCDNNTKTLYAVLDDDFAKDEFCVSVSEENLFSIMDCENVSIKNLSLDGTRSIGVYIEVGKNNTVENCEIKNMGVVGVCIGRGIKNDTLCRHNFWGEPQSKIIGSLNEHIYDDTTYNRNAGVNHTIKNCHIHHCASGGISLGGGDRKTLIPANNTVINCDIHDCNTIDKFYKANINVDGVGNKILHCHLYNATGAAIYMHGNEHLVEYNEIDHACLESEDCGAFYIGRDPSERGNILRNNFFHHIAVPHYPKKLFTDGQGTYSIYNDDGACGTVIESNIFYKGGYFAILHNSANDIKINNNIVIDSVAFLFHGQGPVGTYGRENKNFKNELVWKRLNESIDMTKPPYSTKYPEMLTYFDCDDMRIEVCDNMVLKCPNFILMWSRQEDRFMAGKEEKAWFKEIGNVYCEDTSVLCDVENNDFSINKNHPWAKRLSFFKEIDFKNIGIINK